MFKNIVLLKFLVLSLLFCNRVFRNRWLF